METSNLFHPAHAGVPLPGAGHIPDIEGGEGLNIPGPSFDTIVSTGCAKNHLSIGNIRDVMDANENVLPVTLPSQLNLDKSSSRGPTDDGRIKPDLVANGESIWTLDRASDTLTYRGNGTSFSAPGVTGTLALLEQLRINLGGPPLLSSSWKALLCNTAIDGITLPSYLGTAAQTTTLDGPDYFFGWGACNALGAAELLSENLTSNTGTVHLSEQLLFDGSILEFPVRHDGVSSDLKVMICWTDRPDQTQAIAGLEDEVNDPEVAPADDDLLANRRRLMNDLDLVVIAPDGQTTHYPWVLNPAPDPNNPLKKATFGDANNTNTRDNIEQVLISAPLPGTYTIRITHKGSLKGLDLITAPDPNSVLPDDAEFQLLTGQPQAVSICISGNEEIPTLLPRLTQAMVVAGAHYFQLESHLGVHYHIEQSLDLATWTELPGLLIEAQTFPQPIGPITPPQGAEKIFYRAKPITPSNQ